jgi:hypothetical protein
MVSDSRTSRDRHLMDELAKFPLLDALFGRRARRFSVGMTIPDGPLAYESRHPAVPLNDLERAVLILCGAGISGWNTGMEHTDAGTPDTGCNYPMRLLGRTYPSGAGIYASELFFIDDTGTYLTQFRDLEPEAHKHPLASEGDDLFAMVQANCVKISDERVSVPSKVPHTSAHNLWNANKPGSTLFAPVINLSEQMFDLLAVYMGMGFTPFDPVANRVCGNLDPYAKRGLLDYSKRFSIVEFDQYCMATGAMELGIICHNLVLMLQAMGLGGWMFTGINPPSLMGSFAADGITGLKFRFSRDARHGAPNPIGIDKHFEGLCPPYCRDMKEAAMRFERLKFGPGGTYDPKRPGPFRDSETVKARVDRYTPEFVEMLGETAQYIYDTYGRFPATIPTFYMRCYTQAQHLDMDFYDKFYGPGFYLDSHREHMQKWHASEG